MPAPALFDRLAVLADAARGRVLLLLEDQEMAVSELCQVLQQPQSTVSRQLKALSDGGWLASWREGTSNLYRMAGGLDPAAAELWRLVRGEVAALPAARQDRQRRAAVLRARRARSREFFAESAGEWDRLRRELFGARAEAVPLLGLLDPAWTLGDLGCGTGATAELLAPFVDRVIAVDESDEMLAAAGARLAGLPGAELRRGALEALPVADGELDAAVLMLVLHHLPDPAAVLAEAARALGPGGRLLVVDMLAHDRVRFREEMGHQWLGFEPDRLERWLAVAGFAAVRVAPLAADPEARGPALFAATAARPAAARAAHDSQTSDVEPERTSAERSAGAPA
ncbi:MAG TPA: methyltransferase domain-containing protein [Thermoanaerobaculia bacterium]|nr:methyltransferase domain-containing protein [Thermoanaerobaculia bacterium]